MSLSDNKTRVLLVEDELVIAMFLEDILQEAGWEAIGPISRLEAAVETAKTEAIMDAALLDVNLGRSTVFPVADELAARNIPFIFMTGYGTAGIPDHYLDRPVVTKPYTREMVVEALNKVFLSQVKPDVLKVA